MSHITYQKDRRSGSTYAYQTRSETDPDTGGRRTRREYLGRVDPVTGAIIPKATGGGRNRGRADGAAAEGSSPQELYADLRDARAELERLREEVTRMRVRIAELESALDKVVSAATAVSGRRA